MISQIVWEHMYTPVRLAMAVVHRSPARSVMEVGSVRSAAEAENSKKLQTKQNRIMKNDGKNRVKR